MRARAGLVALVGVVLGAVVSSPASEAANVPKVNAALAARVDRAATDSLLRPEQAADVLAALGLAAPTHAEATFEAPNLPECAKFRDVLDGATGDGAVRGVRFTSGTSDILQTVYSFSTVRAADTFQRSVLDADLSSCTKANVAANQPGGASSAIDLSELRAPRAERAFGPDVFLATVARVTVTPTGGTAEATDFTTFWLRRAGAVTRVATRYPGIDVFDPDAANLITPSATEPINDLVDAATVDLAAGTGLHVGINVPTSPVPWEVQVPCGRANAGVYDTILDQGRTGALSSSFVDNWEISEDGTSYTFKVRDNLQWSDGEPLTAADVAFTIDQFRTNRALASTLGPISDVEASDTTVTVTFSNPAAAVGLWGLTGSAGMLARPGVPYPSSLAPFAYDAFTPGVEAVIENWDDFVRYAEAMTYAQVPAGEALAALRDHRVDIAAIPPSAVDDAKAEGLKVSLEPTGSGAAMYFNYRAHPIFADVNVRRAIAYAIDQNALIEAVLGGHGTVTDVPIGPLWGWQPEDTYAFDPEEAARLLEEAGWPPAEPVDVRVFDGTAGADSAIIVTELTKMLDEAGISADVQLATGAQMSAAIADGSADLVVLSLFQQPYGADTVAQAISSGSGQARALGADATFADSEFGDLFGEVAAASNAEERAKLYREIQELFADETPYLWLYTSDMATAYDNSFVDGTVRSPYDTCGRWDFRGIRSRP